MVRDSEIESLCALLDDARGEAREPADSEHRRGRSECAGDFSKRLEAILLTMVRDSERDPDGAVGDLVAIEAVMQSLLSEVSQLAAIRKILYCGAATPPEQAGEKEPACVCPKPNPDGSWNGVYGSPHCEVCGTGIHVTPSDLQDSGAY